MIENTSALSGLTDILTIIVSAALAWVAAQVKEKLNWNKANKYLDPQDTTITTPPKQLSGVAYQMTQEVKDTIQSNVSLKDWDKIKSTIEANEAAGVYSYVLDADGVSMKIVDGKITQFYPRTSAGAQDQTEYKNDGIDLYSVYLEALDKYHKGMPEAPLELHRNTNIFCNIRHNKEAKFYIKATAPAQEYGEYYTSITSVDEFKNPSYEGGVGNHGYWIQPPNPNGWFPGEYDITITCQQFRSELGKIYQKFVIPVKVTI